MVIVAICEQFGWTYTEYLEQPTTFILLIKEKMRIDADRSERENKKSKTNFRR